MAEELSRWLETAKPALPWALVVLTLIAPAGLVTWFVVRRRLADAKQSEKRAEHLWHNIDCVTEPTVAIDMRPLVASADKAKFNALSVITDMRQRIGAAMVPVQNPPDWTDEELATVKSMTDRSGWPNTYQPRGILPRLRPTRMPVVTPKELGERIKRIRAEQNLTARTS
jgi:hypothetical protein